MHSSSSTHITPECLCYGSTWQLIPSWCSRSPNTRHIIYLRRNNTSMGGQRWHRTEQWISQEWAVLCFHRKECVSYINSLFPLCCINRLRLSKSEMTVVRGFRVIRKWALLQQRDTAEGNRVLLQGKLRPKHWPPCSCCVLSAQAAEGHKSG